MGARSHLRVVPLITTDGTGKATDVTREVSASAEHKFGNWRIIWPQMDKIRAYRIDRPEVFVEASTVDYSKIVSWIEDGRADMWLAGQNTRG